MKKSKVTPIGLLLLEAFRWFDESLLATLKEQGSIFGDGIFGRRWDSDF
jgi:hypothetical protein